MLIENDIGQQVWTRVQSSDSASEQLLFKKVVYVVESIAQYQTRQSVHRDPALTTELLR